MQNKTNKKKTIKKKPCIIYNVQYANVQNTKVQFESNVSLRRVLIFFSSLFVQVIDLAKVCIRNIFMTTYVLLIRLRSWIKEYTRTTFPLPASPPPPPLFLSLPPSSPNLYLSLPTIPTSRLPSSSPFLPTSFLPYLPPSLLSPRPLSSPTFSLSFPPYIPLSLPSSSPISLLPYLPPSLPTSLSPYNPPPLQTSLPTFLLP